MLIFIYIYTYIYVTHFHYANIFQKIFFGVNSFYSFIMRLFIGRPDAEAEAPILWPPDAKSQLTGKDPDAGTDRRQEEKGMTEDEMVGGHHRFNGHEFEQAPGDGDGQGSLASCSPQGHKESDMTK